MPGDIDPASGRPLSEITYGDWTLKENVSDISGDPRHVQVQQYQTRVVYRRGLSPLALL